nr:MAG TPA: hypothetical protein [Caudoviricetes sp.]
MNALPNGGGTDVGQRAKHILMKKISAGLFCLAGFFIYKGISF